MTRNNTFVASEHEPLRDDPNFKIDQHRISGPFRQLNPTRAHLRPLHKAESDRSDDHGVSPQRGPLSPEVTYQWRSRDNRKGRHTLLVSPEANASDAIDTPLPTTSSQAIALTIVRMFTYYPYWNVSWLVAFMFTLGSVIWVVNAFFEWLPLVDPGTSFPGEINIAGGWSAFVGATVFEIGSILLMIEAVNENRAGCFGWALEKAVDDAEGYSWNVRPRKHCQHHHSNKKNFVGKGHEDGRATSKARDYDSSDRRAWIWFPSWYDLRSHYLRELGFLACSAQMFGATVFWVSGFTAIPQIQARLTSHSALDGAFWAPQVIGGSGFIVSGLLFMLESQERWYRPAWGVLGWHIGVWNFIGALGFTLCGALGFAYANSGAQYEASLATFWGSWAFLVGSVIQLYESIDTHPVRVSEEARRGNKD